MKHIWIWLLILALLPLPGSAEEMIYSQEIASRLSQNFSDYAVHSAIRCSDEHQFISLHRDADGQNLLLHIQNDSIAFCTETVLPQGNPVELVDLSGSGNLAFLYLQYASSGKLLHACTFEMTNGKWMLISYSSEDPEQIIIRADRDKVIYWKDGSTDGVTVKGTFERNLYDFSLENLPKSSGNARKALSLAPELPNGSLQATEIKFSGGQKFPVYAYPDDHAYRGAKGKAIVSTNDWIQVFGSCGDYILIQYDISSEKYRIGYIEKTALPSGASVQMLTFAKCMTASALQPTALTDDPMGSQEGFLSIDQGAEMTYLASLGGWAYVETSMKNSALPVRGFVPMSNVAIEPDAEKARALLIGAWHYDAGSEIYYDHLTFHDDGTFTYPYYPDETEGEKLWTGAWSVQPYNEAEKDYYNQTGLEITLEGHRATTSFSINFYQKTPDPQNAAAEVCMTISGLNQPDIEGGNLGYRKE